VFANKQQSGKKHRLAGSAISVATFVIPSQEKMADAMGFSVQ
jgi:hypothetical protein